jgi:5-methylcytosine-specific restriction endonuclease McrA
MTDRPKRKAIPDKIKLAVFARQRGRCALTGKRLASIYACEWDHVPALATRPVGPSGRDYQPPQLSPDYIQALHPDAHKEKTGEDMGRIAKSKRIRAHASEYETRMEKAGKPILPPRQLYSK